MDIERMHDAHPDREHQPTSSVFEFVITQEVMWMTISKLAVGNQLVIPPIIRVEFFLTFYGNGTLDLKPLSQPLALPFRSKAKVISVVVRGRCNLPHRRMPPTGSLEERICMHDELSVRIHREHGFWT